MTKSTRVKICGLKTAETIAVAVEAGASYLGFNFFPASPRYAAPELARELAFDVPPGVAKVGLTVDADDETLDGIVETVPLDMLQFHGKESPERVAELRARYGLPVMKVVGVAEASDLERLESYFGVVDQVMVDAKAPKGAVLPGGNGVAFDWRLIANRRWPVPWMLAGGLNPENVAEAVALTGARQVDLSSGVESAPGVKDPDLIRAFMAAVP